MTTMSTGADRARQPKGIPVGGQFAASAHAEAGVALGEGPATPDVADWSIDDIGDLVSGDSGLAVRDALRHMEAAHAAGRVGYEYRGFDGPRGYIDHLKTRLLADEDDLEPLTVSRDETMLVDGHHRAVALLELADEQGWETAPVTPSKFH